MGRCLALLMSGLAGGCGLVGGVWPYWGVALSEGVALLEEDVSLDWLEV